MTETSLRMVVTVKYDTHDAPLEELEKNLRSMTTRLVSSGWITSGTGAEVLEHDVHIMQSSPVPISGLLVEI